MRAPLLFGIFTVTACTQRSVVPPARFANANVVRVVDDRRDVAKPPARRTQMHDLYAFDSSVRSPMIRTLAVEQSQRARGVNAFDEVPDSTWFTNRIGFRDLTPDEVRNGPLTIDSPGPHVPWTIKRKKTEGESLGLFVTDARGEQFLIKFDRKGFPELETATHMIVDRLLWACGYNVTEDFIVYIRPEDLRLAPGAAWTDDRGRERKFGKTQLDTALTKVEHEPDGRIRVMASRIIGGRVIGPPADEGVRRDDPNDRVPHELRRDLRGLRPIFAWTDYIDVKEENTLDVWVANPAAPHQHYVVHYWLDYGKSLGAMAAIGRDPTRAYEYSVDYAQIFGSLVSVGVRPHWWDDRTAPALVGVGLFESALDPRRWKPFTPTYRPLIETDRFDWLWGAKIVMRFTPAQLRAAVEAGQLSDRRSTEYLISALVARQRAIGSYAFAQVRPIDNVSVDSAGIMCFDDLVVTYKLSSRPTTYVVTTYDRQGRDVGPATAVAGTSTGHVCTGKLPIAAAADQYTMWRITTNGAAGTTFIHVARDPVSATLRLIGLWRQ